MRVETPHTTAITTRKHSGCSDRGGWVKWRHFSTQPSNIDPTLNLRSPRVISPGRSYITIRGRECRTNRENKGPASQDLLSDDLHGQKHKKQNTQKNQKQSRPWKLVAFRHTFNWHLLETQPQYINVGIMQTGREGSLAVDFSQQSWCLGFV